MLVPVEASVVFSLLLCIAAQRKEAHRRQTAAGNFNGSRPRKDAWLKNLLKYDFESRIWDVSWSEDNGVDIDSEITNHASDRHTEKTRGGHDQDVVLNETLQNKLGNHELLSLEHSKKVNDYFVDTQWDNETARWPDQLGLANEHFRSPVIAVPHIVSTNRAEIEGDLSQSKKKQPYSDGYISPENWKISQAVNFNRRPHILNSNEENASVAPILGFKHRLEIFNNDLNSYNNHIIKEAEEEYATSPLSNRKRFKISNNHQSFTAQEQPRRQDSSHSNQYKTAVSYKHSVVNMSDNLKRRNSFRYTNDKSQKKQTFAGHPKRHRGPYQKPHRIRNLKQNKPADQATSGSRLATDRRRPEVGRPGRLSGHQHRLRPTACPRPPCRRLGTFSRPSSPLLAIGAVLLVGTLAALAYLIWLTPPTVVVYSKRQRDSSSGADLLAAPFELSQLTELAAQLSQALAEAELVALKLSADGGRQAERWRRCQPLQLCRALVEGAVIHQQPVWSRYIRAAPWLWLFGLDSSTAARLQELTHRPDFRSCRPFFRPCSRFQ